jgi:hypothetical protein
MDRTSHDLHEHGEPRSETMRSNEEDGPAARTDTCIFFDVSRGNPASPAPGLGELGRLPADHIDMSAADKWRRPAIGNRILGHAPDMSMVTRLSPSRDIHNMTDLALFPEARCMHICGKTCDNGTNCARKGPVVLGALATVHRA